MKIVALAGGVGGAKLAHGLAQVLPPQNFTIIVNTADDFVHLGLNISPDLDTVCYTLGGIANASTGWGRARDTWSVLKGLEELGGPTWFRIGDRDLATHLERTRRLGMGEPLSQIVREFCEAWGVGPSILPMSDDPVRTLVKTDEGDLEFQEYFVHQQCRPHVQGFTFLGAQEARPASRVVEALQEADGIIICPSNPWVSIGPMLAILGIRTAIDPAKTVAISPIIQGRAIKGPADKMYRELGIEPSARAVAEHYRGFLSGFIMDNRDAEWAASVRALGMRVRTTKTLMQSLNARRRLAEDVLDFVRATET